VQILKEISMEAEWLRLEHKGTASSSKDKVRQWFVCEVPDEDENSGDEEWLTDRVMAEEYSLGVAHLWHLKKWSDEQRKRKSR
jgi:hypothetical protein